MRGEGSLGGESCKIDQSDNLACFFLFLLLIPSFISLGSLRTRRFNIHWAGSLILFGDSNGNGNG